MNDPGQIYLPSTVALSTTTKYHRSLYWRSCWPAETSAADRLSTTKRQWSVADHWAVPQVRPSMISDDGPIHWDRARLIWRQPLLRPRRKSAIYRPTDRRRRHYDTTMTTWRRRSGCCWCWRAARTFTFNDDTIRYCACRSDRSTNDRPCSAWYLYLDASSSTK